MENPASLNQRQYNVLYTWGRTDEEYQREIGENLATSVEKEKVAMITQEPKLGIIIINWDGYKYEHCSGKEKFRRGFGELENLLKNLK